MALRVPVGRELLMHCRLLAIAALCTGLAAPGAAEDRPAVVITPGAAQSYEVALRRFADLSDPLEGKADPERAGRLRAMLAGALEFSSIFRKRRREEL